MLTSDTSQKPSQCMLCAVHFPIKKRVGRVPRPLLFEESSFSPGKWLISQREVRSVLPMDLISIYTATGTPKRLVSI